MQQMAYRLIDKLNFGKHKGETIKQVCEDDPTYIEWCLNAIDSFELDDKAMEFYENEIDLHYWDEDSHYPSPHWSDW